jgi:Tol biopolymer transport system component
VFLSAGEKSDYVYDVEREITTRLTASATNAGTAVWAPDSKHLAFRAGSSISWIRSDGAGEPQRLLETQNVLFPWSFSPDGRWLAYYGAAPETGYDIWILPLDTTDPDHPKPGVPQPFLRTPANEAYPMFSPDGHWIAYTSDESATPEIYVRPFSAGVQWKSPISSGGGTLPLWSRNHELFYETLDHRIMVVDYSVDGDSFIPRKPRLWLDQQLFSPIGNSNKELAPDGKGFVVLDMPEAEGGEKAPVRVTMLLNFFDYVKRRAP